ncbi:uncharacterized protein CC84DRAFT_483388 [Paraphaeosphaeria sporulosa]|uniref:Uncharacterized protein n=1 Tax=Paraphaeosphaeria sporulosa TaxID=1460663 RepID=A0A177CU05_9PLEO|nr:uncharacterized protein CC84DRAFT_483388 [Paraphaeosphaeria sporulosa]OAG10402.1 hypothetical protein CC84DRAFT_483388 [Paraphaeosphaeria sporulosa]
MSYRRYSSTEVYGSYTAEDTVLVDRVFNDDRLQKAIQYLKTEGGGDAIDLYLTRVRTIDEHILRQLPAQGKSFNPRLYQRLRDLVREVQNDGQAINDEESSLEVVNESSVEVLYKGTENDSDIHPYPKIPGVTLPPQSTIKTKTTPGSGVPSENQAQVRFASDIRTSGDDDVREKQFLYGGPSNDPEVWYKRSAPLLHIGESPYMERWESWKAVRDLAKGRGKSLDELESPPVFKRDNMYDSGSKYKLPATVANEWSQNEKQRAKLQKLWRAAAEWFNIGRRLSPLKAPPEGKDYAPRMTLPLIGEINIKSFARSTPLVSEGHEDSSADEVSYTQLPTPKHSPLKSGRFPRLPETNLRKFNSIREAATRRDKSSPLSPSEGPVLRTRAALATTPTPETRVKPGLTAGVKDGKRKPGGPVTKLQNISPTPTFYPSINLNTTLSEEKLKGSIDELFEDFDEFRQQKRARLASKMKDPTYHPPHCLSQDEDSPITPADATIEEDLDELFGIKSSKRKRGRTAKNPKDSTYHPPRRISQDADSPTTPDETTLVAEVNELTGFASAKSQLVRYQKPHKSSTDPDWKPDQSPLTPTKRKRDESLDLTPSSKKPKRSKASSSKKKQTPSSSSPHVEFAAETPTPKKKAEPSRKVTPSKSAIKKTKRTSAEDRELASTETLERRGKTRSNKDFKPKRLRSRDETKE